jgi:hypothetical protein
MLRNLLPQFQMHHSQTPHDSKPTQDYSNFVLLTFITSPGGGESFIYQGPDQPEEGGDQGGEDNDSGNDNSDNGNNDESEPDQPEESGGLVPPFG